MVFNHVDQLYHRTNKMTIFFSTVPCIPLSDLIEPSAWRTKCHQNPGHVKYPNEFDWNHPFYMNRFVDVTYKTLWDTKRSRKKESAGKILSKLALDSITDQCFVWIRSLILAAHTANSYLLLFFCSQSLFAGQLDLNWCSRVGQFLSQRTY